MPRKAQDPHLLELAKRGAQAQLADLLHEVRMLIELFPHLRDSYDADELPVGFLLKRGSDRAARKTAGKGRRRTKTAETAKTAAPRKSAAERTKK